jgi:hypothetical protein
MSPQVNFIDQFEVEQVRSWLCAQDDDTQMAAVLEVARLRIMDVADPLFSLRFVHSESTLHAILSSLRAQNLSSALKLYEVDPDQFAKKVEFEVRKLKTTRPDDWWRKNGVGRPKGGSK